MRRKEDAAHRLEAGIAWMLLIPLLAPTVWPLFRDGLTQSFDGATHLLRLGALHRAVGYGLWLPRWLPEMQLGYGYPLFTFYPIGGYYVALAFSLVGVSHYWSYVAGYVIAMALAALGATLLARDVLKSDSPWPGLVAGVTYAYAPYLLLDLYVRGSLPQALSQALLPWVLWSVRRVITRPRPVGYAALLALSLGGLAATHTLTLMLFVPYLVGYISFAWWSNERSKTSLLWVGAGLTMAMGLSAFTWLPAVANRMYLLDYSFATARNGWIPANVWTWRNFLDGHLRYRYDFERPVRVGVVQLILAAAGLLSARRRDAEWLFFAVSALASLAAIGRWSLPIWQSSDVLAVIEFPWRLLTLASLSMAVMTAGLACAAQGRRWAAGVTALVITIVVFGFSPRVEEIPNFPSATVRTDAPMLAQAEVAKGILTDDPASSVAQFRPKWADSELALEDDGTSARPVDAILELGPVTPLETVVRTSAEGGSTLSFQEYFYPSWSITDETGASLKTYPRTNLGLLTVAVSPGDQVIHKRWTGPAFAVTGSVISLLTLFVLSGLMATDRRFRYLALVPVVAASVAIAVWLRDPEPIEVRVPAADVSGNGLSLLGYHEGRAEAGTATIHTYWFVDSSPSADTRFRWQLHDSSDQLVQEVIALPYHNTLDTANWPVGTLVDDVVQLSIPEGQPKGVYQLSVGLDAHEDGQSSVAPMPIGEIEIQAGRDEEPRPAQPLDAQFGASVHLVGADYVVNHRPVRMQEGKSIPVEPGDEVTVILYWRTDSSLQEDLHGFVHLVDGAGHVVAQRDQTPGSGFQPTALWQPGITVRDEYELWIENDAESGVVWPLVGLYAAGSVERVDVAGSTANDAGDAARLAPLKIVAGEGSRNGGQRQAQFGELAYLVDYDIVQQDATVNPGDAITVTLSYEAIGPSPSGLVRFVHLYDAELGMAAQADGVPQQKMNPTWSWVPGERIEDVVVLNVGGDATPGPYVLGAGFYDLATGDRLPVYDEAGEMVPSKSAPIGKIEVEATQ